MVAPTQAMLDTLQTHYGPLPPSQVIYNGRNPRFFRPAAKEALILAVGRLWDEAKNVQRWTALLTRLAWPVYVAGEDQHPSGSQQPLLITSSRWASCRPPSLPAGLRGRASTRCRRGTSPLACRCWKQRSRVVRWCWVTFPACARSGATPRCMLRPTITDGMAARIEQVEQRSSTAHAARTSCIPAGAAVYTVGDGRRLLACLSDSARGCRAADARCRSQAAGQEDLAGAGRISTIDDSWVGDLCGSLSFITRSYRTGTTATHISCAGWQESCRRAAITYSSIEPRNGWSLQNLVAEYGQAPITDFEQAYPDLRSHFYDPENMDLDKTVGGPRPGRRP